MSMLDLVFKNSTADKSYGENFFKKVLDTAAKTLDLKYKKIEVSLNLVSEEEIRKLNKKYRRKDKTTDVLSFPLNEKVLQKQGISPLGDIFICPAFAKNKVKSENISMEKELAQLTVHGFLHLLGYDHEKSAKDRKTMFQLENKILNKLNK